MDVSLHSVAFERMAEVAFLSDLLQETWFVRREVIDVLHSTVDAFGYDLVLWNRGVTRHVQLKTRTKAARTAASYNLATQLRDLPAACVVVSNGTGSTTPTGCSSVTAGSEVGRTRESLNWATLSPDIPRPMRWASKGLVKGCAEYRSGSFRESPQCQNSPSGSLARRDTRTTGSSRC